MSVTPQSIARNTLLNYVSSVLSLVSGIAISAIMARALGPSRLGVYSSLTFTVGLLVAIFGFGVGSTIVKVLSEHGARFGERSAARLVRVFAFGAIVPALLAALALWVILRAFYPDASHGKVAVVAALSTVPAYLAQVYRNIAMGFQDFGFLLRANLAASVLLLCATILVAWLQPGVGAFLCTGIAANALVVALALLRYRHALARDSEAAPFPTEQLRDVFSYLWPVALVSVLDMIVWQYSEVIFLGVYRPSQEVAFYSIAFALASLLLKSVASSVTAAFMPAMSQLFGQGDHERIRGAFYTGLRLSCLVTTPLVVLVALVAKPLVLLFYGDAYLQAAHYVPPLAAAAGLGTISGVAADVLYSLRQQRLLLRIAVFVAIVNLALDALLIPAHGIAGAVIANCVAQTVCAAATLGTLLARYRTSPTPRSYLGPLLASAFALVATWPLTTRLDGVGALVAIGIVGSASYLVGLRALRVLSLADARAISNAATQLPSTWARRSVDGLVRFCAPHLGTP